MTLKHLKNRGVSSITFDRLDQFMSNNDRQQFDFETFKAAYDSDPRIPNVVTNFDQDKIDFKQSEVDDLAAQQPNSADVVGAMASKATDLGDNL